LLGERLFLLGLIVVALVAAIYAAPKAVRLSIGYGTHIGGPDDDSLGGSSLLVRLLARLGYDVVLETGATNTSSMSVVYLVSNPTRCSPQALEQLVNEVERLIGLGVHVSIVISDEALCAPSLAGLLGISQPITYSVSPRDYVVFTQGGELFALHTVMVTEPTGKWLVQGYTYPDALPGLLVYNSSSYTIIYIPDSDALTNAVLLAENETGLSPMREIAMLMSLAGAEPGNTTVITPLYLYRQEYTAAEVATKIHPGILVLEALSYLSAEEHRLIKMLEAIPGALAATSLIIAAPMYLVMREAIGGAAIPEEEERAPLRQRGLLEFVEELPRHRPAPGKLHRAAKAVYETLLATWRTRYSWSLLEEEAKPKKLSPRELAAIRKLSSLASSRARCLLVARPRRVLENILRDLAPVLEELQEGGKQRG